jgi:beta-glucosidase
MSDLQIHFLPELPTYPEPELPVSPGGNSALYKAVAVANVTVSNTGSIPGATVAQLYLSFPKGSTPSGTPVQVLRGFDKVTVNPGRSTTVMFELTRKDVSYWDVVKQDWKVPSGSFNISVGFSSRDIKVRGAMILI